MTCTLQGPIDLEATRDREGYREYSVTFLVRADLYDGPANAMQTPGLPLPGSYWLFTDLDPVNGGTEVDIWAYCKLDAAVKIHEHKQGELTRLWTVMQKFSTKGDNKRCKDVQVDDPLQEPMKISGGCTNFQEEATHDRFGQPILNSAFEVMRGPQLEFDKNRPFVNIEQNVPRLQLALCSSMVDTVNANDLWDLPPRCIKLSTFDWDAKFYGHCLLYFTRKFKFDVRNAHRPDGSPEGFDRDVLDEGTKVLAGHWDPSGAYIVNNIVISTGAGTASIPADPGNPAHFIRFKDRNGENMRGLLAQGLPADVQIGTGTTTFRSMISNIHVEKYDESDFLQLNIPATLE